MIVEAGGRLRKRMTGFPGLDPGLHRAVGVTDGAWLGLFDAAAARDAGGGTLAGGTWAPNRCIASTICPTAARVAASIVAGVHAGAGACTSIFAATRCGGDFAVTAGRAPPPGCARATALIEITADAAVIQENLVNEPVRAIATPPGEEARRVDHRSSRGAAKGQTAPPLALTRT